MDSTLLRTILLLLACLWVAWFDFGLQAPAGAFFNVLLDYHQSDRPTTAAVLSVFIAVNRGLGLPVGLLIHRFGITKVSSIGSILVPLGLLISAFATSICQVLVCFGLITATGVSMIYVSSATVLRQTCSGSYKKWLRMSIALQFCCLSFAGFTFPFLIAYLNELYALPGVFLIFSGILLNNICVHLLFFYAQRDRKQGHCKQTTAEVETCHSISTSTEIAISPSVLMSSKLPNLKGINCISATRMNDIHLYNTIYTKNVKLTKFTKLNEIDHNSVTITNPQTSDIITCLQRTREVLFSHFSKHFLCIFVASAFSLGTEWSFLALKIDILKNKGISEQLALNAYIPLQIFAFSSRFITGFFKKLDTSWLLALFSTCGAVGQIVIMLSHNYYLTLFGVGLSGMTLGGVTAASTIEVASAVSKTTFPVAFGQIFTGAGIVTALVTPFYGALRDYSENYDIVLATTAAVQILSAILYVFGWLCKKTTTTTLTVVDVGE